MLFVFLSGAASSVAPFAQAVGFRTAIYLFEIFML
jgi:hypothetical protein